MSNCSVDCLNRPDAVDKTNWKCNECGTDLKKAHEERQKKSAEHYKNIANQEKEAINLATEAFNKVFKDEMRVKD